MSRPASTPGRAALLALLQTTTRGEVAKALSVHRSAVSWWASGKARPSALVRARLALLYGIPPNTWGAPSEKWARRAAYCRS